MAVCRICNKKTQQKFCCTEHAKLWYSINFPDHKCLTCGEQLFPDGISHREFLKRLFCSNKCRTNLAMRGFIAVKSNWPVGSGEVLRSTLKRDNELIHIIFKPLLKKFYYVSEINGKIRYTSGIFNSFKELLEDL